MYQELSGSENPGFRVGMPLNEYLLYMQTIDSSHDSYKENEEDLYITSRKNKQSVLENAGTYEIRETEEDNYEESHEGNIRKNCQKTSNEQEKINQIPVFSILQSLPLKNNWEKSRGFRVRKQFNGNQNFSKNNSSKFLPPKFSPIRYQSQIGLSARDSNIIPVLCTKYRKNLKQASEKNEYPFRKQNKINKKIKQILGTGKNQKDTFAKYCDINQPGHISKRVQGKTDRLHNRKSICFKNHT